MGVFTCKWASTTTKNNLWVRRAKESTGLRFVLFVNEMPVFRWMYVVNCCRSTNTENSWFVWVCALCDSYGRLVLPLLLLLLEVLMAQLKWACVSECGYTCVVSGWFLCGGDESLSTRNSLKNISRALIPYWRGRSCNKYRTLSRLLRFA